MSDDLQEMRQHVKERVAKEEEALKEHLPADQKDGAKDFRFISTCLNANELGDGALFVHLHRDRFAFDHRRGNWLEFDGVCWRLDILQRAEAAVETGVVGAYLNLLGWIDGQVNEALQAKDEGRQGSLEATRKKIIKRIDRIRTVRGVSNALTKAITGPDSLGLTGEEFDQQPELFPCPSGVIDLRSGQLLDGRPDQYLSIAAAAPFGEIDMDHRDCPLWKRTLMDIFMDDEEMVAYLKRLLGYGLLGTPREHIFPVFWGHGRNGKGVIMRVLSQVLGDLAGPIPAEMLLDSGRVKNTAGPSPDILALKGRRIVWASETDENRRFSPAKVKWLTGGDTLIGRAPYSPADVRFEPTHLLILLTNSKPHAPATDYAFWERVHLIEFLVSFVNREPSVQNERRAVPDLAERIIKEEASAVLGWLVAGCLEYQANGLRAPAGVVAATAAYRRDEDFLADWIEECCEQRDGCETPAADLRNSFNEWYTQNVSKFPPSGKKFGQLLGARFEKIKNSIVKYRGIGLSYKPES